MPSKTEGLNDVRKKSHKHNKADEVNKRKLSV